MDSHTLIAQLWISRVIQLVLQQDGASSTKQINEKKLERKISSFVKATGRAVLLVRISQKSQKQNGSALLQEGAMRTITGPKTTITITECPPDTDVTLLFLKRAILRSRYKGVGKDNTKAWGRSASKPISISEFMSSFILYTFNMSATWVMGQLVSNVMVQYTDTMDPLYNLFLSSADHYIRGVALSLESSISIGPEESAMRTFRETLASSSSSNVPERAAEIAKAAVVKWANIIKELPDCVADGFSPIPYPKFEGQARMVPYTDSLLNFLYGWKLYYTRVFTIEQQLSTTGAKAILAVANKTLDKSSNEYKEWREADVKLRSHLARARTTGMLLSELEPFILAVAKEPARIPTAPPNKVLPMRFLPRSMSRRLAEAIVEGFFTKLTDKVDTGKLAHSPYLAVLLAEEFVKRCVHILEKEVLEVMTAVTRVASSNRMGRFPQDIVDEANNTADCDYVFVPSRIREVHDIHEAHDTHGDAANKATHNTEGHTPSSHSESDVEEHEEDTPQKHEQREFAGASSAVRLATIPEYVGAIMCFSSLNLPVVDMILNDTFKDMIGPSRKKVPLVIQNNTSLDDTFKYNANLVMAILMERLTHVQSACGKIIKGYSALVQTVNSVDPNINIKETDRLKEVYRRISRCELLYKQSLYIISLAKLHVTFCQDTVEGEDSVATIFDDLEYIEQYKSLDMFSLSEEDLSRGDKEVLEHASAKVELINKVIIAKMNSMSKLGFDYHLNIVRQMPKTVSPETKAIFTKAAQDLMMSGVEYFKVALNKIKALKEFISSKLDKSNALNITKYIRAIEIKVVHRYKELIGLQSLSRDFAASEYATQVEEYYGALEKMIVSVRHDISTFWDRSFRPCAFMDKPILKTTIRTSRTSQTVNIKPIDSNREQRSGRERKQGQKEGCAYLLDVQYEINIPKDLIGTIRLEFSLVKNGMKLITPHGINERQLKHIEEVHRMTRVILGRRNQMLSTFKIHSHLKHLFVPALLHCERDIYQLTESCTWATPTTTVALKCIMKDLVVIERGLVFVEKTVLKTYTAIPVVMSKVNTVLTPELIHSFLAKGMTHDQQIDLDALRTEFSEFVANLISEKVRVEHVLAHNIIKIADSLSVINRFYLREIVAALNSSDLLLFLHSVLGKQMAERKYSVNEAINEVFARQELGKRFAMLYTKAVSGRLVREIVVSLQMACECGFVREILKHLGNFVSLFVGGNQMCFKVAIKEAYPSMAYSVTLGQFAIKITEMVLEECLRFFLLSIPSLVITNGISAIDKDNRSTLSPLRQNNLSARSTLRLLLAARHGFAPSLDKLGNNFLRESEQMLKKNEVKLKKVIQSAKAYLVDVIINCHNSIVELVEEAKHKADKARQQRSRRLRGISTTDKQTKQDRKNKGPRTLDAEEREEEAKSELFVMQIESEFQKIDQLKRAGAALKESTKDKIIAPFLIDVSYVVGELSQKTHRAVSQLADLLGFGVKIVIAEEKLVINTLLKTLAGISGLLHVKTQDDMKTLASINPAVVSYIATKMRQASNTLAVLNSIKGITGCAIRQFVHKDMSQSSAEGEFSATNDIKYDELDVTKQTIKSLSLRYGQIDRGVMRELDGLIRITKESFVNQKTNYGDMLARYRLSFSNLFELLSKRLAVFERRVVTREMYTEINEAADAFEKKISATIPLEAILTSKAHINALLMDKRSIDAVLSVIILSEQKVVAHKASLDQIEGLYKFLKKYNSASQLSLASVQGALRRISTMLRLNGKFFGLLHNLISTTNEFLDLKWEMACEMIMRPDAPGPVQIINMVCLTKVPKVLKRMQETSYKGSLKVVQYMSDFRTYIYDIFLHHLEDIVTNKLHMTQWIQISAMIKGFTLPPPGQTIVRDFLHLDFVARHNDLEVLYNKNTAIRDFELSVASQMDCFDRDVLVINRLQSQHIPSWISTTSVSKFIPLPLIVLCEGKSVLQNIDTSSIKMRMCRLFNQQSELSILFTSILDKHIAILNDAEELIRRLVSFQSLIVVAFNLAVQMRVDHDARFALYFGTDGDPPKFVSVDPTGDMSQIRFPLNRPHDAYGLKAIADTPFVMLDKSPEFISLTNTSAASPNSATAHTAQQPVARNQAQAQKQQYLEFVGFKHNSLIPSHKRLIEKYLLFNVAYHDQSVNTETIPNQATQATGGNERGRTGRADDTKGDSTAGGASTDSNVSGQSLSHTKQVKTRKIDDPRLQFHANTRKGAEKNNTDNTGAVLDKVGQGIRTIQSGLALDDDDISNIITMFPEGHWFPRRKLERLLGAWENLMLSVRGMNSASEMMANSSTIRKRLEECVELHKTYFDDLEKMFVLMQRKICPQFGILSSHEVFMILSCPELPSLYPRCDWVPDIVKRAPHGYLSIKEAAAITKQCRGIRDVISEEVDLATMEVNYEGLKTRQIGKVIRVIQKIVPGLSAFVFSSNGQYAVGAVLCSDVVPGRVYNIDTLPKILFFSRPVVVGLRVTENIMDKHAQMSLSIWLQFAVAELQFSIKRNFYYSASLCGLVFPSNNWIISEVNRSKDAASPKNAPTKASTQSTIIYQNVQDGSNYTSGVIANVFDTMPMVSMLPFSVVLITFYIANRMLGSKATSSQTLGKCFSVIQELKSACMNIQTERTTLYSYPLMIVEYYISILAVLNSFTNFPTKVKRRYQQYKQEHYSGRQGYKLLKRTPKAQSLFKVYKVFLMSRFLTTSNTSAFFSMGGKLPVIFGVVLQDYQLESAIPLIPDEDIDLRYLGIRASPIPALTINERGLFLTDKNLSDEEHRRTGKKNRANERGKRLSHESSGGATATASTTHSKGVSGGNTDGHGAGGTNRMDRHETDGAHTTKGDESGKSQDTSRSARADQPHGTRGPTHTDQKSASHTGSLNTHTIGRTRSVSSGGDAEHYSHSSIAFALGQDQSVVVETEIFMSKLDRTLRKLAVQGWPMNGVPVSNCLLYLPYIGTSLLTASQTIVRIGQTLSYHSFTPVTSFEWIAGAEGTATTPIFAISVHEIGVMVKVMNTPLVTVPYLAPPLVQVKDSLVGQAGKMIGLLLGKYCFRLSDIDFGDQSDTSQGHESDSSFYPERNLAYVDDLTEQYNYPACHMMRFFESSPCVLAASYDSLPDEVRRAMGVHMAEAQSSMALNLPRPIISPFRTEYMHNGIQATPYTMNRLFFPLFNTSQSEINKETLFDMSLFFSRPSLIDFFYAPPKSVSTNVVATMSRRFTATNTFADNYDSSLSKVDQRGISLNSYLRQPIRFVNSLNNANTSQIPGATPGSMFTVNVQTEEVTLITTLLYAGLKSFSFILDGILANPEIMYHYTSETMAHILYRLGVRFEDLNNSASPLEEHVVHTVLRSLIQSLLFIQKVESAPDIPFSNMIIHAIFITFYFGIRCPEPYFKRIYCRNLFACVCAIKGQKVGNESTGGNQAAQDEDYSKLQAASGSPFAITSSDILIENPDETFMRALLEELPSELCITRLKPHNPCSKLQLRSILRSNSLSSQCVALGMSSDPNSFYINDDLNDIIPLHPMKAQAVCNILTKQREKEVRNAYAAKHLPNGSLEEKARLASSVKADRAVLKEIKAISQSKYHFGCICFSAFDVHLVKIHQTALEAVRNHPEALRNDKDIMDYIFTRLKVSQPLIVLFLINFIKIIGLLGLTDLNENALLVFKLSVLLGESNKVMCDVRHSTDLASLSAYFSYALAVNGIEPYKSAYCGKRFEPSDLVLPRPYIVTNGIRYKTFDKNMLDSAISHSKWTNDRIFINATSTSHQKDFESCVRAQLDGYALYVTFRTDNGPKDKTIITNRILNLTWLCRITTIDIPGASVPHNYVLHFKHPFRVSSLLTDIVWGHFVFPVLNFIGVDLMSWVNNNSPILTRIDSKSFDKVLAMLIMKKLYDFSASFHMYLLEGFKLRDDNNVINRIIIRVLGDEGNRRVVSAIICDAIMVLIIEALCPPSIVIDKLHLFLEKLLMETDLPSLVHSTIMSCDVFASFYNEYATKITSSGNVLGQVIQNVPLVFDWNIPELEGRAFVNQGADASDLAFYNVIVATTIDFVLNDSACYRGYVLRSSHASRFLITDRFGSVIADPTVCLSVFGTKCVIPHHISFTPGIDTADDLIGRCILELLSVLNDSKTRILEARNLVLIIDVLDIDYTEVHIVQEISVALSNYVARCGIPVIALFIVSDPNIVTTFRGLEQDTVVSLGRRLDKRMTKIISHERGRHRQETSNYEAAFNGIDLAIYSTTCIDGNKGTIFTDGHEGFISITHQRLSPETWKSIAVDCLRKAFPLFAGRPLNRNLLDADGEGSGRTPKKPNSFVDPMDVNLLFDYIVRRIQALYPQTLPEIIVFVVVGMFFHVLYILHSVQLFPPAIYDINPTKLVVVKRSMFSTGVFLLDIFIAAIHRLVLVRPFCKLSLRQVDFKTNEFASILGSVLGDSVRSKNVDKALKKSPLSHGVCFLRPDTIWGSIFIEGFAEGIDTGITKRYAVFAEDMRMILLLAEAIISFRCCPYSNNVYSVVTNTNINESEWIVEATITFLNLQSAIYRRQIREEAAKDLDTTTDKPHTDANDKVLEGVDDVLEFNRIRVNDNQQPGSEPWALFEELFYKLATSRAFGVVQDEFEGWSAPQCVCFEFGSMSDPTLLTGPISSFVQAVSHTPIVNIAQFVPTSVLDKMVMRHNSTVTSAPLENNIITLSRFITNRLVPLVLLTNPQSGEQLKDNLTGRLLNSFAPGSCFILNPNKKGEIKTLVKASLAKSVGAIQDFANPLLKIFVALQAETKTNFYGDVSASAVAEAFVQKYQPIDLKRIRHKVMSFIALVMKMFAEGHERKKPSGLADYFFPIESSNVTSTLDMLHFHNEPLADDQFVRETKETLYNMVALFGDRADGIDHVESFRQKAKELTARILAQEADDPMSIYRQSIRPIKYESVPAYEKIQSIVVSYPKVFMHHLARARTFTLQTNMFTKYMQTTRFINRAEEVLENEKGRTRALTDKAKALFANLVALKSRCYDKGLKLDFLQDVLQRSIKKALDEDKNEKSRKKLGKAITQSHALLEELRRMINNIDDEGLEQVQGVIAFLLDPVKLLMGKPLRPVGAHFALPNEELNSELFDFEDETVVLPSFTPPSEVTKESLQTLFESSFKCCLTPEVLQLMSVTLQSSVYLAIRQTYIAQYGSVGTCRNSSVISESQDVRMLVYILTDWIESVLDSGGEETVVFVSSKQKHVEGADKIQAKIEKVEAEIKEMEKEANDIEARRDVLINEIMLRRTRCTRVSNIKAKLENIKEVVGALLLPESARKLAADMTYNALEYTFLLTVYYALPDTYRAYEGFFMDEIFDMNSFKVEVNEQRRGNTVQPPITPHSAYIHYNSLYDLEPTKAYPCYIPTMRLKQCGALTEDECSLLYAVSVTPYVPVIFDPYDVMGMMVFSLFNDIAFFASTGEFIKLVKTVCDDSEDISKIDISKLPPVSYVRVTNNDLSGNSDASRSLLILGSKFRRAWPKGNRLILLCREASSADYLLDFTFFNVSPTATTLAFRHACQRDEVLYNRYRESCTTFNSELEIFGGRCTSLFRAISQENFEPTVLDLCEANDGAVDDESVDALQDEEHRFMRIQPLVESIQLSFAALDKAQKKYQTEEKLLLEVARVHLLPVHVFFASEQLNKVLLCENTMALAHNGERNSIYNSPTVKKAKANPSYSTMRHFSPITERDTFDTVRRVSKSVVKQQGRALQQVENQIMYRQNTEILLGATKALIFDSMSMLGQREKLALAVAIALRIAGTNEIGQTFAVGVVHQSVQAQTLDFTLEKDSGRDTARKEAVPTQLDSRRRSQNSPVSPRGLPTAISHTTAETGWGDDIFDLMRQHIDMDLIHILEGTTMVDTLGIKTPLFDYVPINTYLTWSRSRNTLHSQIRYHYRDSKKEVPFSELSHLDSKTIKGVLVYETDGEGVKSPKFWTEGCADRPGCSGRELYFKTVYIWFNAILTIALHPTIMLEVVAKCMSEVTYGCIDSNSILFNGLDQTKTKAEESAINCIRSYVPVDSYYLSVIPLAMADCINSKSSLTQLSSLTDFNTISLSLEFLNHCNNFFAQPKTNKAKEIPAFEPAGPITYLCYSLFDREIHDISNIISITQQPILLILSLPSSSILLMRELGLCSGERSVEDSILDMALHENDGSMRTRKKYSDLPWWLPLATVKQQKILAEKYIDANTQTTSALVFHHHPLFRLAFMPNPFLASDATMRLLSESNKNNHDLDMRMIFGDAGTDMLTHSSTEFFSKVLGRKVDRSYNLSNSEASSVITYNDIAHVNGKSEAAAYLDMVCLTKDYVGFTLNSNTTINDTLIARAFYGSGKIIESKSSVGNEQAKDSDLDIRKEMPQSYTLKSLFALELSMMTYRVTLKIIYLDYIDNENRAIRDVKTKTASVEKLSRSQLSDRAKERMMRLQREPVCLSSGDIRCFLSVVLLATSSSVGVDANGKMTSSSHQVDSNQYRFGAQKDVFLDDILTTAITTSNEAIQRLVFGNNILTNASKAFMGQVLSGPMVEGMKMLRKSEFSVAGGGGNEGGCVGDILKGTVLDIITSKRKNVGEDSRLCSAAVSMLVGNALLLRYSRNDPTGVINSNIWKVKRSLFISKVLGNDWTDEKSNKQHFIGMPSYKRLFMYSCLVEAGRISPYLISNTSIISPTTYLREQTAYRYTLVPTRSGPVTYSGILPDMFKICLIRMCKTVFNNIPVLINLSKVTQSQSVLLPEFSSLLLMSPLPIGNVLDIKDLKQSRSNQTNSNHMMLKPANPVNQLSVLNEFVESFGHRRVNASYDNKTLFFIPPHIIPLQQTIHIDVDPGPRWTEPSQSVTFTYKRLETMGLSQSPTLAYVLYPLIVHYNKIVNYISTISAIMQQDVIMVSELYDPTMRVGKRIPKEVYTIGTDILLDHLPTKWNNYWFNQYHDEERQVPKKLSVTLFRTIARLTLATTQLYSFLVLSLSGKINSLTLVRHDIDPDLARMCQSSGPSEVAKTAGLERPQPTQSGEITIIEAVIRELLDCVPMFFMLLPLRKSLVSALTGVMQRAFGASVIEPGNFQLNKHASYKGPPEPYFCSLPLSDLALQFVGYPVLDTQRGIFTWYHNWMKETPKRQMSFTVIPLFKLNPTIVSNQEALTHVEEGIDDSSTGGRKDTPEFTVPPHFVRVPFFTSIGVFIESIHFTLPPSKSIPEHSIQLPSGGGYNEVMCEADIMALIDNPFVQQDNNSIDLYQEMTGC